MGGHTGFDRLSPNGLELRVGVVVSGAHGADKLPDLVGILEAFAGLDARAHVNGQ